MRRKFTSFFMIWVWNDSSVFFLFFFLISIFFFKLRNLLKKKKSQNDFILAKLTAGYNWSLMEYQIDNNWKVDNWNDKIES